MCNSGNRFTASGLQPRNRRLQSRFEGGWVRRDCGCVGGQWCARD
jgi:hypothetical protein